MSKTAFITGVSGQDGDYLSKLLLKKGYKVIGGERRSASGTLWRLKDLNIEDDIEITDFELSEFTNIYRAIDKYNPEDIFILAPSLKNLKSPVRQLENNIKIRYPNIDIYVPLSDEEN